MKAKIITIAGLLLMAAGVEAQTLKEFKPKDVTYGLKKLRDAPKKIYIAGFDVNFQVYNEKEKFKQGGAMLGGGMKGDAMAAISVGLEGLDEKSMQEITDRLYKEYIDKLKAKGFTIITPDEAAKIESYADYERVQGGTMTMAQIPGVMTMTPTGFEYFIKGTDKKGKEKKGGFLGNQASMFPRLSKELGDAIIGNVDLTVLFVSGQNAFQGNGAKLKVKTNMRLVGLEAVEMASDKKFKFKGQNEIASVNSNVDFYYGKMGASAEAVYIGTLGKNIEIDGVIDESTVTSFASGGMDGGTKTIYGTFYSARNGNNKNAKIIPVDSKKYCDGVYLAAKTFIDHHTDEFLKSI